MAGNRVLEFKVFAASLVRRGVMQAKAELASLKAVAGSVSTAGRALGSAFGWVRDQAIKLAAGVAVAAAALAYTVQKAFTFEKYTLQFRILFGNLGLAKKHMAELADFAASTPFELEGIVDASRLLMTFSEGVLGTANSLRLVGDAAAATGSGLSEVAMWVGRAYSMIASGRPFGEAAMRLQEMGVLTAAARNKMEDLQKAGASAGTVFGVLQKDLGRFAGGMDDLSKSGDGLVSTLKDNVNLALKDFGEVFMEDAKNALREMIAWLDRLRADGTITEWAKKARAAIGLAAEIAKAIAEGGGRRSEALAGLADVIIGAFKYAAGVAVELLMKAAPFIGDAIVGGAMKAWDATTGSGKQKAQDQAEAELIAEGKMKPRGTGIRRETRTDEQMEADRQARKKAIADRVAENREKELSAAGEAGAKKYSGSFRAQGKEQMQDGLDQMKVASDRVAYGRLLTDKISRATDPEEKKKLQGELESNQALIAADKQAAIDRTATENRQAQIDGWKKAIAKAKPEMVQVGIDALKALTDGFEDSGVGAGSGKWKKQFDDYLVDRAKTAKEEADLKKALDQKELDRKKVAMDAIAGLMNDPSAQGALDAAKKEVADQYKRDGQKLDPSMAKPWEDVLASMKDKLEKSPAAIKSKTEDLEARQAAFRLSMMSPADQLKARQKTAADLEAQVGKETDPEKKLDIRSKLLDELEAIQGLKTKGKGLSATSIGMGDVFTRMYGQEIGSKDPTERTAVATEQMLKILDRIDKKPGGMRP